MYKTYSRSHVDHLAEVKFFEGNRVILRKGGKLFGKQGPTKIPIHVKKGARLEFFKVNDDGNLVLAAELSYLPFPVIPNPTEPGTSLLYLHNQFTKKEPLGNPEGKKIVQLANSTFIGLFIEDNKPLARSPQFYIQSKKNLKKRADDTNESEAPVTTPRKRSAPKPDQGSSPKKLKVERSPVSSESEEEEESYKKQSESDESSSSSEVQSPEPQFSRRRFHTPDSTPPYSSPLPGLAVEDMLLYDPKIEPEDIFIQHQHHLQHLRPISFTPFFIPEDY